MGSEVYSPMPHTCCRMRPVRSASRTPSPTPDAGVRYTVRPGDALELIAGQYGVSSAAIVEENDLVPPYILEVGQVLVIPTEQ